MRRMLGALRQADETDQREVAVRAGSDPGTGADAGDPAGAAAGDVGSAPKAPEGSAPLSPAPRLAKLDRLISRTATAGLPGDVTPCATPMDLPASLDP